MNRRTLLTYLLILPLVLSACGSKSELNRNRDKWDSSGVTHYRFELTVSCFCAFVDIMPVVVEVKDGTILSMTGADGHPVSMDLRPLLEKAATVEGLFAIAQDSLSNADQVEITYDETYGFPTSIKVDWIKMAADDEIYYYVGTFKVMP